MNADEIEIENLIKDQVENKMGFELVGVEVKRGRTHLVRVFIDRYGGIDVEMCADVSTAIDPIINNYEGFSGEYKLEVSSPGIERPLMKQADFIKFNGSQVIVRTKELKNGRRKHKGVLVGASEDGFAIETDDVRTEFIYDEVLKANLVVEF